MSSASSNMATTCSSARETPSMRPASSSNVSIASSCVSMGKLFGDDTSNTSPTAAFCLEAFVGGHVQ